MCVCFRVVPYIYIYIYIYIYFFFLAALGLCCCAQPLQLLRAGATPAAVRGLLIAVASPVAEHGLQARAGLSSCDLWAPERRLSSRGAQA